MIVQFRDMMISFVIFQTNLNWGKCEFELIISENKNELNWITDFYKSINKLNLCFLEMNFNWIYQVCDGQSFTFIFTQVPSFIFEISPLKLWYLIFQYCDTYICKFIIPIEFRDSSKWNIRNNFWKNFELRASQVQVHYFISDSTWYFYK